MFGIFDTPSLELPDFPEPSSNYYWSKEESPATKMPSTMTEKGQVFELSFEGYSREDINAVYEPVARKLTIKAESMFGKQYSSEKRVLTFKNDIDPSDLSLRFEGDKLFITVKKDTKRQNKPKIVIPVS